MPKVPADVDPEPLSGEGLPALPIPFLDIEFTPDAEDEVLQAITRREAAAAFDYIVTPNVDHIVRIQMSRSDLWPAYHHAWMTLCDSRVVARIAAWDGVTLPVVPGSDLTAALFEHAIRPDDPVAILGAGPGVVQRLAERYGLRNVTHYNPPMGFITDRAEVARAVDFLVNSHARYSFLAVGSPQQEMLAYRVRRAGCASGVGLCVGASLDFLAGAQRRAPRMMQRMSLEWLYRLASNPRRLWRRYLVEGPLIVLVHRAWRHRMLTMG